MDNSPFYDFKFKAEQIARFAQSNNFFTLLMRDGTITHYEARPEEAEAVRNWLLENNIPDAKSRKI